MLTDHQVQTLDRIFWKELQGISWSQIGHVYLLALLVFIPGIIRIIKKKSTFWQVLLIYWITVWAGIMFLITILRREPGYASGKIDPFPTWDNFGGNGFKTVFTIYNIMLFVPWGFLIRLYNSKKPHGAAFFKTLLISLCTTCAIEITQLITTVGNFEFTDILSNFIGGFIGAFIGGILVRFFGLFTRKKSK